MKTECLLSPRREIVEKYGKPTWERITNWDEPDVMVQTTHGWMPHSEWCERVAEEANGEVVIAEKKQYEGGATKLERLGAMAVWAWIRVSPVCAHYRKATINEQ